MRSGAANPRGPGARSLAEGVGEGRRRATNRRCRGEGKEGWRGGSARGLRGRQRPSWRGGLWPGWGPDSWAQRKTLFSRKSGLLPFWQS
uniref:Uncharacterized protein n=1 Tax=Marmota marmota marmota TaxID=9994 RepID=A0A8C6EYN5_MARMA